MRRPGAAMQVGKAWPRARDRRSFLPANWRLAAVPEASSAFRLFGNADGGGPSAFDQFGQIFCLRLLVAVAQAPRPRCARAGGHRYRYTGAANHFGKRRPGPAWQSVAAMGVRHGEAEPAAVHVGAPDIRKGARHEHTPIRERATLCIHRSRVRRHLVAQESSATSQDVARGGISSSAKSAWLAQSPSSVTCSSVSRISAIGGL